MEKESLKWSDKPVKVFVKDIFLFLFNIIKDFLNMIYNAALEIAGYFIIMTILIVLVMLCTSIITWPTTIFKGLQFIAGILGTFILSITIIGFHLDMIRNGIENENDLDLFGGIFGISLMLFVLFFLVAVDYLRTVL